jgi:hypothetical protein
LAAHDLQGGDDAFGCLHLTTVDLLWLLLIFLRLVVHLDVSRGLFGNAAHFSLQLDGNVFVSLTGAEGAGKQNVDQAHHHTKAPLGHSVSG